jgi:hypothetical protein
VQREEQRLQLLDRRDVRALDRDVTLHGATLAPAGDR